MLSLWLNRIILSLIVLWLLFGVHFMASLSTDPSQNITLVKKLALQVYGGNQVMADLTTAQAILESNLEGKPSQLAFKYNNLFGIKGSGTKGSVSLLTTEYVNGNPEKIYQPFAWNSSVEDSLNQRKELFQNGTTDDPSRYYKVLSSQTFEQAAVEVFKAGYATDENYSRELIDIYNKYIKNK